MGFLCNIRSYYPQSSANSARQAGPHNTTRRQDGELKTRVSGGSLGEALSLVRGVALLIAPGAAIPALFEGTHY